MHANFTSLRSHALALLSLLLCAVSAVAQPTAAQPRTSQPTATQPRTGQGAAYIGLTTNPVSLLFGVVKLEAEIGLPKGFSIEPEVAFHTEGVRLWSSGYESEGQRFGLVLRRYFIGDGLNDGFYGMVYGRQGTFKYYETEDASLQDDEYDFELKRLTVGFGLGYQKTWPSGFSFGSSLGVGRNFVDEVRSLDPSDLDFNPNSDAADLGVGNEFPINVYGRISFGYRIFSQAYRQRALSQEDATAPQ